MPDRHLNFVYQLDGDVTEIDVFKLAPTLLALGELIQQSNRQLFPGGPDIAVNVKPFRKGSFIVDLTLFSASNLRQYLDLFAPHNIEQLKSLLGTIGLIVAAPTTGLVGVVQALKFLRGRPKSVEEIRPGEYRLTTIDDRSLTIDQSTHQLLQNSSVTNNIYKIYSEPFEGQTDIQDVKTYLKDDEATAVRMDREEISGLRESIGVPPMLLAYDGLERTRETVHNGVFLNPKRGAFGDDPKDWSFYRGEEIITATIRDKDFLTRYANGEVRLNQSDLLTVDLLERQKVSGTHVQKPSYEVLKVTHYEKGATQLPLAE